MEAVGASKKETPTAALAGQDQPPRQNPPKRIVAAPAVLTDPAERQLQPAGPRVSAIEPRPPGRALKEPPVALASHIKDLNREPLPRSREPQPASEPAIAPSEVLPALPRPKVGSSRLAIVSFCVVVLLPILLSSIYFLFIAADQYVSVFRFSVHSQSAASPTSSSSSGSSALSSIVSSLGGSSPGGDTLSDYVVVDYLQSRQSIEDVSKHIPVRDYFTTPRWDFIARLSPSATIEQFVDYWPKMVTAGFDPATGIASVEVHTFDPKTAERLATELMNSAERLVNEMEERSRRDMVSYAEQQVDFDQKLVDNLSRQALKLRTSTGVIDPSSSVVTDNVELSRSLVSTLTALRIQYGAAATTVTDQNSIILKRLRDQIKATEDQLRNVRAQIGSDASGSKLPTVVGEFEKLNQQVQLAQQSLAADVAILQAARLNAIGTHIYLMSHVKPTLATSAEYPERYLDIGLTALISLGAWLFLALFTSSVRSHLF